MKPLRIATVVTFVFFLLAGMAQEGTDLGAGARARGRGALADALNHLLVEPLTMPGALLVVFTLTAAICFLFARLASATQEH